VLYVHHSSTGEALVDALAGVLAAPPTDPFAADVVAVPAKGVERWIAQRLSHRLGADAGDGVCAQVVFPRPGDLLDGVLGQVSQEHAAAVTAWHPDRAVWALLDVFDTCRADAASYAALRLDDPARATRRYGVARRVARLFATYAASRPELVRSWVVGDGGVPEDLRWQPELWRRLRDALRTPSPAETLDVACRQLVEEPASVDLPERLSVFGVSRIDTARLHALAALAGHRDVHVFVHHPSPALWSAVGQAKVTSRRRADLDVAAGVDHPLLASTSRDVRELQVRLALAAPDHAAASHDAPTKPANLLSRLQQDLHTDAVPPTHMRLDPHDRSVQVHACHGRARQVEVLREVILGILAADPTLEPRDVLVMCPDVETYAPLVAATFAADSHPGAQLRVSIADRSPRQTNPMLATAGALLELANSRVTGAQVLDLAASTAVKHRFRLSDDDIEQLRGWIVATGIHWGLDHDHREPWQLDRIDQGTWHAGLDRLLTGVALGEVDTPISTALPLDGVESTDVDLVGRFAELVDRVATTLLTLRGRHSVPHWLDALQRGVEAIAQAAPDAAWQEAQLAAELDAIREAANGSTTELTLADVTTLLDERLQGRPTRTSFRTGGMTVCTLTPMRSVPHRVICLLGLDDGSFPRRTQIDSDDILAREPHIGERDPRSEDRQLFLDAILAAGEHLVVTYSGADVRTGATLPPAVPVGELLDALDATAFTADGEPARRQVVVHHPLQPFDPRNFTEGELGPGGPLSFDTTALAGAQSLTRVRTPPPAFLDHPLPPPPDEPDVTLQRLVEFFQHPARGFLRQRLDATYASRDEEPDDAMPLTLDGLQKWQVGDRMLQARLKGTKRTDIASAEAARGELPPGPLGSTLLQETGDVVDQLVATAAPHRTSSPRTLDVDVELGEGRRVVGTVNGVHGNTVLTVTYSRLQAKQRLRAWVELLALTASQPDHAWQGVVIGRGERLSAAVATLGPVDADHARSLLAELVAVRDAGLRVPLPLPMATTAAYAAERHAGRRPDLAESAARAAWTSSFGWPREDADPEHVLLWGESAPFDALRDWTCPVPEPGSGYASEPSVFGRLACRVWLPLLGEDSGR
jgi:exodeoxyribonuclease V gamma subunit